MATKGLMIAAFDFLLPCCVSAEDSDEGNLPFDFFRLGFEFRVGVLFFHDTLPIIRDIPLEMRQVKMHPDDGNRLITIPNGSLDVNPRRRWRLSLAPEVGVSIFSFRAGMSVKERKALIEHYEQGNGIKLASVWLGPPSTSRGFGSSLVYVQTKIRESLYDPFAEMEIRLFRRFGVIGGVSRYRYTQVIENGWDRYGSHTPVSKYDLGATQMVEWRFGFRIGSGHNKYRASVLALGGPIYSHRRLTSFGQTVGFYERPERGFVLGLEMSYGVLKFW